VAEPRDDKLHLFIHTQAGAGMRHRRPRNAARVGSSAAV